MCVKNSNVTYIQHDGVLRLRIKSVMQKVKQSYKRII